MKKFFVLCFSFLCFASCSSDCESVFDSIQESDRFEVVSYQPLSVFRGLYVIRDTQTGHEYLLSSGSHDISVCPLNQ